jgi:ribosomal silencing factor RsfS
MSTTTLLDQIKAALEEKKAEDIVVLDVHNLTSVCDYMII